MPSTQKKYNLQIQKLTRCLQLLSVLTRPDIPTITSLISKHNHSTTLKYIQAMKYIIRYLKGIEILNIVLVSKYDIKLHASLESSIRPNIIPTPILTEDHKTNND